MVEASTGLPRHGEKVFCLALLPSEWRQIASRESLHGCEGRLQTSILLRRSSNDPKSQTILHSPARIFVKSKSSLTGPLVMESKVFPHHRSLPPVAFGHNNPKKRPSEENKHTTKTT
ncbi:hypothetical protein V6N13_107886 [Hibiscus sabdariffa]